MSAEPHDLEYGLKPSVMSDINAIFACYPEVDQVILYGSRAMGNFKRRSDIDLCMVGDSLTLPILLKIDTALDDLLLPYKIDLSIHSHIQNAELLDHMARNGAIFYRKGSAPSVSA